MSDKHTPGPWIAVGTWVEHPDDDIPDICFCAPGGSASGRSDAEACANARLIAAAPELLVALQNLMNATLPGMPLDTVWVAAAHEQARAAIDKAAGAAT